MRVYPISKMFPFVLVLFAIIAVGLAGCSCGDDDDDDSSSPSPTDDTSADDTGVDDTAGDDTTDDDTVSDLPIPAGIYDVAGEDSIYGAYSGEVEIIDADPNFIRAVRYSDVTFPDPRLDIDYEVHTAWTGTIVGGATPVINVELKVGDAIASYGDLERTDEDKEPLPITGYYVLSEENAQTYNVTFTTEHRATRALSATETWTYRETGGTTPIFVNEDTFIPGHEPMPGPIHNLIYGLLSHYHSLEWFDGYRDREDFQSGVHYIPRFRSDFEWYRENPGALRVANKWLDEISMAETMLRARAFSPTFGEKAAFFDEEMPEYYLNSLGFFGAAQWGSDPLEFDESGDSLLWSGCYLAGQVFRYLVTGEQAALDNWLRVLDALFLTQDIVPDPTTFARAVRLHVEDGSTSWIRGEGAYEDYDWLSMGNNDMIQGLYYGYILSWMFLPEDAAYDGYRANIATHAAMLADNSSIANDGEFNEIKAHWLAYVTTGDDAYRVNYQSIWSNPILRLYPRMGGGMFYIWGISDWSGQHLDTIGMLILDFLAQASGDTTSLALMDDGWSNGMRFNGLTQTLFPVAAYALSDPPAELDPVFEDALWNLRSIPYPKQALHIDKHVDGSWCPSPIPDLFWKLDWWDGGRWQGLWGVPHWERMHSNMLICAPSDFELGETDWTDGGGADFLHTYWLGRYFGVLSADD